MRRDTWIPLVALAVIVVALASLPPERHVGHLLVPIFVHGALIRTGVVLFLFGALMAIIVLAWADPWAQRWTRAFQVTALVAWAAGFVVSFYPSYVTWGTPIAWSEPRTQMVVRVMAVAVLVFGLARWINDPRAIAAASALVGLAVPLLVWRTGVIRHPIDPIGTSPSLRFQVTYLLVLLCTVAIGLWSTYRLAERGE